MYDNKLASRIRKILFPITPANEKKLFGGICFLVDGNMTVGVIKDDLIVRVGKEKYNTALKLKGAKFFDFTGKPMAGWIMVSPAGCATDKALEKWIVMAMEFIETLPPK